MKVDRPLVSILICTYNRAHLLPEALESVFSQTYEPVEIIVLDDGSTDETEKLVAGYGDRVRYYKQKNQGIAMARSKVCTFARGDLITFQDDDDLMPPGRIEVLYEALCEHPNAVFAVGDLAEIDEEGKLTGKRWLPQAEPGNCVPRLIDDGYAAVLWSTVPANPHTVLFWKALGEKIGWFDLRYQEASEDKDFFARLGKLGPIVHVPEIVSWYRRGHDSLSSDVVKTAKNKLFFLKNHLEHIDEGRATLKKRLRFRMFLELKKIAKSGSFKTLEGDGVSEYFSYLTLSDRLRLWAYFLVKRAALTKKRLLNK